MEQKASRGRPRAYDPKQALDAALLEFRRRGYTGTSLDHLSDATKMARPSLYAAFGNKLEIYRKAVAQYASDSAELRTKVLFENLPLSRGLREYFDEIIRAFLSKDGEPLGCPILSVISGEAAADPEIAAELSAGIKRADAEFLKRIKMAAASGEISAKSDVHGIAALLASLQHTLALRARAGETAADLTRLAKAHIALTLKSADYSER